MLSNLSSISPTDIQIQMARKSDLSVIFWMIQQLAHYEQITEELSLTEETLFRDIFETKKLDAIVAKYQGQIIGCAMYFVRPSVFKSRPILFLDALYVHPNYRKMNTGHCILRKLGEIALEHECEQMEWWCLGWNYPAISFYKKLGAVEMDEWTVYRAPASLLEQWQN